MNRFRISNLAEKDLEDIWFYGYLGSYPTRGKSAKHEDSLIK